MSKSKKREKASKKAELRKVSILEHELVPQHRILSPEEAKEILARYGVQPQQLPYILVTDPVVKELGAKPGDIIEIRRKSPTAGEALYYRLVVTEE